MNIFLGILLTFAVFLLVVLIHEFGHFIVARMSGMKVLEFWFGIPPKIKKIFTDKKGTDFTFNLLPIGGFVRIFGEDPSSKDAFAEGSFMSKSLWKRFAVLVAGVAMNFLLAWVIFTGIFLTGAKPLAVMPINIWETNSYFLPSLEEAKKTGFVEEKGIFLTALTGSIAEKSGILPESKIIAINHLPVTSMQTLIDTIEKEENIQMELQNASGSLYTVKMQPENGKIGVALNWAFITHHEMKPEKKSFSAALNMGIKETYASSILTFKLLGKTFKSLIFPKEEKEREEAKKQLSGPIGVGNTFVTMVDKHIPMTIIWIFVALISVNLGVLNILPFPALDGGRIVTTTVYSFLSLFIKSKIKILKIEQWINMIGFLLLMAFMIYVMSLDIGRFF